MKHHASFSLSDSCKSKKIYYCRMLLGLARELGTPSPRVHRGGAPRLPLVRLSPRSGGRHEAVVVRAAELRWSALTPGAAHTRSGRNTVQCRRLRKRLRAAEAEAAPAEWRAPSMRRLALVLLPCAVAVLVHLWLAHRPSSTPLDNNTHSGTFQAPTPKLHLHEASELFASISARRVNFAPPAPVCLLRTVVCAGTGSLFPGGVRGLMC